jgi:3-oxoacyl-[acyl-carrier-protein] synthase II
MSDYTRESLLSERPYLVNAALFPNTVMNCAAGQAAIWYGLKGVNVTIAGGQIAFFQVLRYASNVLQRNYSDVLLVGAVEEFTPHTAWVSHLGRPAGSAEQAGEGAAVFVAERMPKDSSEHVCAEILSVETSFSPRQGSQVGVAPALERCIRRALGKAKVSSSDVSLIATEYGPETGLGEVERDAVCSVFGSRKVERLSVKRILGECYAASAALQLAVVLTFYSGSARLDGKVSVLTGWTRDGGVGAVVLRGRKDVGNHRC